MQITKDPKKEGEKGTLGGETVVSTQQAPI